ncbi:MAG: extracellular solute-binding protein [Candidatus Omnitrophica bacterium]|nr:extracellular solute-binding protein [Candidatus Omnitrophota bacterium]
MRHIKRLFFIFPLLYTLNFTPYTASYADEPVTLTLWEFSANEQLMRELLDKFEALNPGVKINLQQLTWEYGLDKFIISLAAGNAPDICELGTTWMAKIASAGTLLDITDDTRDIKGNYFLWETATYDNRIYGVPWLSGTRALFYNKALFRENGLDAGYGPATWQALLTAAKKIHAPRKGIWGFSIAAGEAESPWQQFLPFVWASGGSVLSEDRKTCALDSPETLRALEFYKELSTYSLIERQAQINELFAEGKVGMQISGSWNLRLIPRLNPQLDFGVALLPECENTSSAYNAFAGGELFVITKKSKYPKEAMALIRFLTSKENVMALVRVQQNVVPAQKDVLQDPYYEQFPEQKVFLAQLKTAMGPPNHPQWTQIQEYITGLVEETIMTGARPKAALEEASRKIEALLQKETKKTIVSNKFITALSIAAMLLVLFLIFLTRKKKPHAAAVSAKPFILISPWLLTFLAFGLYPLLYSIIISFSKFDILKSQFEFVGMKNYLSLLADPDFHRALWHTLVFSAGTVPFTVGLALFCAVLINRKIPFKQLYQAGLFVPVTTSVVVIATVFTYIYSANGLANWVLDYLGIIRPQSSWLTSSLSWLDISIPLLSIMAMNIWASFGYYTILFLAGLQTVPESLYEVAALDGATEWQKFRFITFPQLKPVILLAVVLNTIYSLQVFPEIFTMTMGGPLGSTTTAVYYLYELGFHRFEMGKASSVAYILSVIILLFSLLQMRLLKTEERLEE